MIILRTFILLTSCATFVSSDSLNSRVDCHPEPGCSEERCLRRQCLFQKKENNPDGIPPCFYPPQESGYVLKKTLPNGTLILKADGLKNPFGRNIGELTVKTRANGKTLFVSIGCPGRHIPQLKLPGRPSTSRDSLFFQKMLTVKGRFAFRITRQSNNRIIWDTTIGGLLFADKFIQIATYLPSKNIFGFGEHVHKTLRHNMSRYTTWPMLARGRAPEAEAELNTANLYGVHPFYLCVEDDGNAHGVLVYNSNAQEVTLGPHPHLVYRTIGGQIDLVFFPGPSPGEVIQQYLMHIGTPFLPPYWALGFQLSRWGYKNLEDLKETVARVTSRRIPLDVIHVDIDYMDGKRDFTIGQGWKRFPEYVRSLHGEKRRLVLIFDPPVEVTYAPFQRAVEQNVSFIEWENFEQVPREVEEKYKLTKNTKIMLADMWPREKVAFPDFLDERNNTFHWWKGEIGTFHEKIPFDGMWLDQNEPATSDTDVFRSEAEKSYFERKNRLACPISGPDSQWDNPPYRTHAGFDSDHHLSNRSICLLGRTGRGSNNMYNTRNIYGAFEAKASYNALKGVIGKRPLIISRSTFPSSGRYGGHWLGDNTAHWEDLKTSIIGVVEFNWFGIPYVGADICGFYGNTNEELCLRWHQIGAFHSFSRNHNTYNGRRQDPSAWPSVEKATKIALEFRYRYLPYLYSLHYKAALVGGTVIRPLFFQYPSDSEALKVDHQFMWGDSLLFCPVFEPNVSSVSTYFSNDVWYSLYPATYGNLMRIGYQTVAARNDSLVPVFVRGGSILPRQKPSTTISTSRENPFELLIACDSGGKAIGELFYDGGESDYEDISQNPNFHFAYEFEDNEESAVLTIRTLERMKMKLPHLDLIEILGCRNPPNAGSIWINDRKMKFDSRSVEFDYRRNRLLISKKDLVDMNEISENQVSTIRWNHSGGRRFSTSSSNSIQTAYILVATVILCILRTVQLSSE